MGGEPAPAAQPLLPQDPKAARAAGAPRPGCLGTWGAGPGARGHLGLARLPWLPLLSPSPWRRCPPQALMPLQAWFLWLSPRGWRGDGMCGDGTGTAWGCHGDSMCCPGLDVAGQGTWQTAVSRSARGSCCRPPSNTIPVQRPHSRVWFYQSINEHRCYGNAIVIPGFSSHGW